MIIMILEFENAFRCKQLWLPSGSKPPRPPEWLYEIYLSKSQGLELKGLTGFPLVLNAIPDF